MIDMGLYVEGNAGSKKNHNNEQGYSGFDNPEYTDEGWFSEESEGFQTEIGWILLSKGEYACFT